MKTPEEKKAEAWVCDHLGQETLEEDCTLDCQLKIAYLAGRNAGIDEAANVCPDCFPATRRSILELKESKTS